MNRLPIVFVLLLWLPGCGDDEPVLDEHLNEPGTMAVQAPPELSEYEKVIASRPKPQALKRQHDATSGVSMSFPANWRVDRNANVVYQVWASKDGPAAERYVENITVTTFEAPDTSLDEHLATMRENTPAVRPGLKEIMHGARKVGDLMGRIFRYSLPWKKGNISEEVTILKHDGRFCVIVGSCHEDDREQFATTYKLILQSLQWKIPEPK